mgnify:CR=1 FL=1
MKIDIDDGLVKMAARLIILKDTGKERARVPNPMPKKPRN